MKVSGTIDNYPIQSKNLAPKKDSDKFLSIGESIRNAIQKNAGDTVLVTLSIDQSQANLTDSQILDCFEDAQVLGHFKKLNAKEQKEILTIISSEMTEEQQSMKIIHFIERLSR